MFGCVLGVQPKIRYKQFLASVAAVLAGSRP